MKNKIIAVVGYKGRMGSVVFEKLKERGLQVVGIDKNDSFEKMQGASVVVDFSVAEMAHDLACWCVENNASLVVGATGHTRKEEMFFREVSKEIAVMKCDNFSRGVSKIKEVLKNLDLAVASNIVVYEKHHSGKKDAPSGTAKMLKAEIEKICDMPVQTLCERGGKEVGFHSVNVYFENEMIAISHQAYSREVFADGVACAVEFMLKNTKAGWFNFDEIV